MFSNHMASYFVIKLFFDSFRSRCKGQIDSEIMGVNEQEIYTYKALPFALLIIK